MWLLYKRRMRNIFKEVIVLTALSAILAVTYHLLSGQGLSLQYQKLDYDMNNSVLIEHALELWMRNRAVFVDARSREEFREKHIKNAHGLPLESSRLEKISFLSQFEKGQPFIIYCSNMGCTKAEHLAAQFKLMGFRQVAVLASGIDSWLAAGHPVSGGISDE